jgi:hypothetical protein
MSGGTLLALAADEIALGEFSVLGPIDRQIVGLSAASIVKARDSKPLESVLDLTLVLPDVAEKALVQVNQGVSTANSPAWGSSICRYAASPASLMGEVRCSDRPVKSECFQSAASAQSCNHY